MRGDDGGAGATAQQAGVQIQADQKHIKNDAELRDQVQERRDRARKNVG